ncbi:hypothetical protein KKC_14722 [Listeria fleischmannii subsp. coloradonensis]|nr:hypothetical protein KKC_14722 [Listeria fleischmannii subsp. coloradonensis]
MLIDSHPSGLSMMIQLMEKFTGIKRNTIKVGLKI